MHSPQWNMVYFADWGDPSDSHELVRHSAQCCVVQQELVRISSRDCNNMQNKSSFPLDLHLFCRWCSLILWLRFTLPQLYGLANPYSTQWATFNSRGFVLSCHRSSETSVHFIPPQQNRRDHHHHHSQRECNKQNVILYSWRAVDTDCTGNDWLLIETRIAAQQRISYDSLVLRGEGRTRTENRG